MRLLRDPVADSRPGRSSRFAHAGEPFGVFSYVGDAIPRLSAEKRAEVRTLLNWFGEHLDEPQSVIPTDSTEECAVCWFGASAQEHVARARRLAVLVRGAGIPIVERWSDRIPGEIRSGDHAQIVAASFWH